MTTPEERKLAEEKAAVEEQDRQRKENIRIAKERGQVPGTGITLRPEALPTVIIQAEIVGHIENSLTEMTEIIERKGSAKEMAIALRPAAMLTLAKDMLSMDSKVSQPAALQILNRSDGTGKGEGDEKPVVNVNIMNVSNEELARRLAFMDRLREEKNA